MWSVLRDVKTFVHFDITVICCRYVKTFVHFDITVICSRYVKTFVQFETTVISCSLICERNVKKYILMGSWFVIGITTNIGPILTFRILQIWLSYIFYVIAIYQFIDIPHLHWHTRKEICCWDLFSLIHVSFFLSAYGIFYQRKKSFISIRILLNIK